MYPCAHHTHTVPHSLAPSSRTRLPPPDASREAARPRREVSAGVELVFESIMRASCLFEYIVGSLSSFLVWIRLVVSVRDSYSRGWALVRDLSKGWLYV